MQHIDIFAGLGNQMFQYAFYLSKLHMGCAVVPDISLFRGSKDPVMHNGFELKRVFNLNSSVVFYSSFFSKYFIKFALMTNLNSMICRENYYLGYQEQWLRSDKYHIYGYWQSERYFKDVADIVRKEFVFKDIDHHNLALAQEMQDDSEYTSVSIHVRRGDYFTYNLKVLDIDYYEKAVNYIKSKIQKPRFYFFSDDMQAAIEIAGKLGIDCIPVLLNSGVDSYKDMFLMSQCKHNIIANSSFSWWGAWLNNNESKIVITPSWGRDFKCEDWILIKK